MRRLIPDEAVCRTCHYLHGTSWRLKPRQRRPRRRTNWWRPRRPRTEIPGRTSDDHFLSTLLSMRVRAKYWRLIQQPIPNSNLADDAVADAAAAAVGLRDNQDEIAVVDVNVDCLKCSI